jgi:hypothetical protein
VRELECRVELMFDNEKEEEAKNSSEGGGSEGDNGGGGQLLSKNKSVSKAKCRGARHDNKSRSETVEPVGGTGHKTESMVNKNAKSKCTGSIACKEGSDLMVK